jgi:hypothetical protein
MAPPSCSCRSRMPASSTRRAAPVRPHRPQRNRGSFRPFGRPQIEAYFGGQPVGRELAGRDIVRPRQAHLREVRGRAHRRTRRFGRSYRPGGCLRVRSGMALPRLPLFATRHRARRTCKFTKQRRRGAAGAKARACSCRCAPPWVLLSPARTRAARRSSAPLLWIGLRSPARRVGNTGR